MWRGIRGRERTVNYTRVSFFHAQRNFLLFTLTRVSCPNCALKIALIARQFGKEAEKLAGKWLIFISQSHKDELSVASAWEKLTAITRLKNNMKLQCDQTVVFSIAQKKSSSLILHIDISPNVVINQLNAEKQFSRSWLYNLCQCHDRFCFQLESNLTRQLLAFASSSPSTLTAVRSTNSNRSRPHRSASRHLDDSCSFHLIHTQTSSTFLYFFSSRQLSLSLSALAIDLSQNRDSRNKEKKIIFQLTRGIKSKQKQKKTETVAGQTMSSRSSEKSRREKRLEKIERLIEKHRECMGPGKEEEFVVSVISSCCAPWLWPVFLINVPTCTLSIVVVVLHI